jgi:hypothetical protein
MKHATDRFLGTRLVRNACAIVSACLAAVLTLAPVPCAFGQTYYELTVHNNFGPGEFYGATPTDAQIWLLTNFKFDYLKSGAWTTGNATPGSWAVVQMSQVDQGRIRLYREYSADNYRFYAMLSDTQPAAAQPDPSTTIPNNYFEWSFKSAPVPGTLDLSWIDRWDFLTRMEVSNLPITDTNPFSKMIYGAKQGQSTAAVSAAINAYTTQSEYAWLGTFSDTLSFPGATSPIGWVTRNQDTGSGWASGIKSFTHTLDKVISQAAGSTEWKGLTSGIGPNWTRAGFRVGYPEDMPDPAGGTTIGQAWTAYVGFTKDPSSGAYTMRLTDFTLYNAAGGHATVSWSAVNNDSGAVYEATQAQGVLECIWCSSWNNLSTTPDWVANILRNKGNGANIMYAVYNALASGVIYKDEFVNNTPTPAWTGAVPRIQGVTNYNFEIFTAGEPADSKTYHQGLAGMLNGPDMITLLEARQQTNALLNPYMLELLRTAEVTPAYLYPSQDMWACNGIAGDSPVLGLQTGPLDGAAFGDNATLGWYLGGGGGAEHHHLYVTTDGNCGTKSPCYDSIQDAMNAASTGSIIWIAAGTYSETITLSESKTLIFQGGWDTSFEQKSGTTTLKGAPAVQQGSLTMQELKIEPK